MPVIRHTPEQRAEYAKNPASLGLPLQTLRGQFSEVVPPEEKTIASFDLGPMSATERRRGGDYSALGLGPAGALWAKPIYNTYLRTFRRCE